MVVNTARCPKCGNPDVAKEKITIGPDRVVREYFCPRCKEFAAAVEGSPEYDVLYTRWESLTRLRISKPLLR